MSLVLPWCLFLISFANANTTLGVYLEYCLVLIPCLLSAQFSNARSMLGMYLESYLGAYLYSLLSLYWSSILKCTTFVRNHDLYYAAFCFGSELFPFAV